MPDTAPRWRLYDGSALHGVRVRRELRMVCRSVPKISIHAPREGCDHCDAHDLYELAISIHAPREGCDTAPCQVWKKVRGFQSTHPVRGATKTSDSRADAGYYFNPRTP